MIYSKRENTFHFVVFHAYNEPCGHTGFDTPEDIINCEYSKKDVGSKTILGVAIGAYFIVGADMSGGFNLDEIIDNMDTIGDVHVQPAVW